MPVIYLEDIVNRVGNKYLAVNIAAQRARQLNERGIPMLSFNARKPVSLALEELMVGKLGYEETDRLVEASEDLLIFSPVVDEVDEDSEELDEFQPTPEYFDDNGIIDLDEPEEGL